MAYDLRTKNGHNFWDMASMLQKAIRRCDYERAGYAANELFDRYRGYLWRKLLIISAEDCYGIMTKEIIALKMADEAMREPEKLFVSKAIVLLCCARKNKDADYFSCNLMKSEPPMPESEIEHFSIDQIEDLPGGKIPKWVYSWHTRKGREMGMDCVDSIIADQQCLTPHQESLFDREDWAYHIDKSLTKFNPKRRPHVGINWDAIGDFRE